MNQEVYIERSVERPAAAGYRRVSWGAIFAGLFVTMIVQVTLTLLGVAIGAATIDPLQERNPGSGLAMGSAIWFVASALISLFAGACVAGRLSGGPRRSDGMLHGVVTWSVAETVMLLLLTTAVGSLLGGTGSLLNNLMAGTRGGAQAGQGNMVSALQNEIREAFPQAGAVLPPTGRPSDAQHPASRLSGLAQQDPELATALTELTAKGGVAQAPAERDRVVQLLTSKHSMDEQQASTLVTQWDSQMQQTKNVAEQKAREVGDKAASGVSKGALFAFIGMILGLAVAAWGGWVGTASLPRYRETTVGAPAGA